MSEYESYNDIMNEFQMASSQEQMELDGGTPKRKADDTTPVRNETDYPHNKSPPLKVNRPKDKKESENDGSKKLNKRSKTKAQDPLQKAALQVRWEPPDEPSTSQPQPIIKQIAPNEDAIREAEHSSVINLLKDMDKASPNPPLSVDPELVEARHTYRVSSQMMDY